MTDLLPSEREYLLKVMGDESLLRKRQARRLRSRMTAIEQAMGENTGETKRLSMMVHRVEKRSRWNRTLLAAAVFAAPHVDPVAIYHFLVSFF
jgi:hypothetical protein